MSDQMRRCTNCGAANRLDARQCAICGSQLAGGKRQKMPVLPAPTMPFDPAEGEDDLMVRGLTNTPLALGFSVVIILFLTIAAVGIFLWVGEDDGTSSRSRGGGGVATATSTETSTPFPTNTPAALYSFPTVTPLPATATATPTQGPCIKRAGEGDTLYGLALQCGHRHYSIVEVIIEQNPGLGCETCLSVNQEIIIPWPTSLPGTEDVSGAAVPPPGDTDVMASAPQSTAVVNEFGTPDNLATLYVEPTLRPGLMWHYVEAGETMGSIAIQYSADAKVLSDINPELEFEQCDFSQRFGGEECRVMLGQGQRVRVPAPTPTPTLSPTLSGSETPTPTATPTFNVPSAFSPEEGTRFDAASMITLRWSASGTLGANEMYVIQMKNLDTGREYQDVTDELFFVIPDEWQPTGDQQYEFEWTIGIAVMDGVLIVTERAFTAPRHFVWEG